MHRTAFIAGVFAFMLLGLYLPIEMSRKYLLVTMACTALIVIPQFFFDAGFTEFAIGDSGGPLLVRNFTFGSAFGALASMTRFLMYDTALNPAIGDNIVSILFFLGLILIIIISLFREIGRNEDAKKKMRHA